MRKKRITITNVFNIKDNATKTTTKSDFFVYESAQKQQCCCQYHTILRCGKEPRKIIVTVTFTGLKVN